MTIIDFDTWLAAYGPGSIGEGYCLYKATFGESYGVYNAKTKGGKVFISREGDETTLALVSDDAIHYFRKLIERYNPHKEMGLEGAMIFVSSMGKGD